MDRGAWWATVHRVAKNQTRLEKLHAHASILEAKGVLDSWNLLRQIKWTDTIDSINLVK